MANLKGFAFTNRADKALSSDGWVLNFLDVVDALGGNDTIGGSGSVDYGIYVLGGSLNAADGADLVQGNGGVSGIYVQEGTVATGAGADTVTGSGSTDGIYLSSGGANPCTLDTGAANDVISGSGSTYGVFLYKAAINTGDGNDSIAGTGIIGINNFGTIDTGTGKGSDAITGNGDTYGIAVYGSVLTGGGGDLVTGSANYVGIYIDAADGGGSMDTGDGADVVRGVGSSGIFSASGVISTGAGGDVVDAWVGGFSGPFDRPGLYDLGSGDDVLKGCGFGVFRGGDGVDTLILWPGTYTISAGPTAGSYLINNTMNVTGFESFGSGANISSFSAAVAAGSVTFA